MKDAVQDIKENPTVAVITRSVRIEDIGKLRPIIEAWVRDSKGAIIIDEVEEIIERMALSISGENQYHYLIAETALNGVVGMIGYRPPEDRITEFVTTAKPAEGVNFFVAPDMRGQGVGRTLNLALKDILKQNGYTQYLFESGPRYIDSGYGFHNAHYQRIGEISDRYGHGLHAPVWGEVLK